MNPTLDQGGSHRAEANGKTVTRSPLGGFELSLVSSGRGTGGVKGHVGEPEASEGRLNQA